jgi:hypothetical protein
MTGCELPSMTILWRRITWFTGFALALLLATWMRHRGFDWPATISASVAACIILPLFISQVWADAILIRREGFRWQVRSSQNAYTRRFPPPWTGSDLAVMAAATRIMARRDTGGNATCP